MKISKKFIWMGGLMVAGLFVSCSTPNPFSFQKSYQSGESVVLVDEEPAHLAFAPIGKTIRVRNTYRNDLPQTIRYEIGRDFVVDDKLGQIKRTPQSRIPNFRTNLLYGAADFDHGKFPGFGNGGFFAYVDYDYKNKAHWPVQKSQTEFLPKTQRRFASGQRVKIIAFGDSITAGGDATEPSLIFWQRWADELRFRHPGSTIEAINGATGGDTTVQGLQRLEQKVLSQNPDLVLIGFGMNDHNITGVPLENFENNLRAMIDRIRAKNGAEIILFSTFPPNPKWHYGSKQMAAYALATENVAREKECAFANVYENWNAMAARKKPEDLLSNNVNHPNDFGHWIYFRVLQNIGL